MCHRSSGHLLDMADASFNKCHMFVAGYWIKYSLIRCEVILQTVKGTIHLDLFDVAASDVRQSPFEMDGSDLVEINLTRLIYSLMFWDSISQD